MPPGQKEWNCACCRSTVFSFFVLFCLVGGRRGEEELLKRTWLNNYNCRAAGEGRRLKCFDVSCKVGKGGRINALGPHFACLRPACCQGQIFTFRLLLALGH